MVKTKNKDICKNASNQVKTVSSAKAAKIGPSTHYEYISERLSPFGGLLGLVKFMDLIKFQEIFDGCYIAPSRMPKLGHYKMVYGLIMLLFIGFNRVWHFIYIQIDSMLCSIFNVAQLPFVTTYWRYVNSLTLNQGKSLLQVMSTMRERVWCLCDISLTMIHIDIDTTVSTVFGNQEGGRKGHNTKNRGKKGFRSVLCFIEETREYLTGKLRTGETMGGEEIASLILTFKKLIPGCVEKVILRGDGEFISWESVDAALSEGFMFIFGNKSCKPPFDSSQWYKVRKNDLIEYNECMYKPMGWGKLCRFVVMRIPIALAPQSKGIQLELFEDAQYKYRIFVTNLTVKAHKVIKEYDKRADCENLMGEAKREGIAAMPSRKFSSNYAYFQIVMLTYNIWRSFKMLAGKALKEKKSCYKENKSLSEATSEKIVDQTIRIARLKLLLIAAKVASTGNTTKVKYSEHDSRTSSLFKFYEYMDILRQKVRPWLDSSRWESRHMPLFLAKKAIG